jgi:hypothetical protein
MEFSLSLESQLMTYVCDRDVLEQLVGLGSYCNSRTGAKSDGGQPATSQGSLEYRWDWCRERLEGVVKASRSRVDATIAFSRFAIMSRFGRSSFAFRTRALQRRFHFLLD